MKKIILILLVIIYSNSFATDFNQYGLGTNIGYNFYPSSFSELPGIPNCCTEFTNANGISYGLGGIYEYYFEKIGISSNLSINHFEGEFLQKEAELFSVNYEPVWGTFNHHLNFNVTSLDLFIGAKYKIEKYSIGIGLKSSVPISNHFNQFESISVPNGRVFFIDSNGNNTGSNIRNERSGKIPELSSVNLSPSISFGYDLPLNNDEQIILQPNISVNYQINNLVSNLDWKRFEVNFSINILFNNLPKKPSIEIIKENIINQDSINREIEKARLLAESRLNEQKRLDSINKFNELQKRKLQDEMAKLDSLNNLQKLRDKQLAEERIAFDKMIEEQNKISGKKCDCFVIQFISTSNKNDFSKLLKKISKIYNNKLEESEFIEPYQKIKYYRLQSKCYTNHLDAFDDRANVISNIDETNFLPQILCK